MAELWGPQRKFSTWRRCWIALAEAQQELGLDPMTEPFADELSELVPPQEADRVVGDDLAAAKPANFKLG